MTTATLARVSPSHHQGSRGKVLAQDALYVVSDDPVMAAEVDAEWQYNPALTFGANMAALDRLCAQVCLRHDFEVGLYRHNGRASNDHD